MIPFARMLEYGNEIKENIVLDIDFSTYDLGTRDTINDNAGNNFVKSGSGETRIVYENSIGRVMYFGGSASFICPMNENLSLSSKSFEMRVVFMSTVSNENIILSTGDYYNPGGIVGGMALALFNPYAGSQLFCTTSTGDYTMCSFSYLVNTWRDISFFWDNSTRSMRIYDNVSLTNIGNYTVPGGFGDGTNFCIGASYVRGTDIASFQGYLKKIKITEIGD